MSGLALLLAAFLTAGLAAASLRLRSLVSALLAAYVVYVAQLVGEVLVLSPFRAVDRAGIAVLQLLLLAAAAAFWWRRGRPLPPLGPARRALRRVVSDPVTLLFVLLALAALAYELTLGLTVPANDYDGLSYHLVRAAEWAQHHGYFWVGNAPFDPINNYGPIAEQEILFSFAAVGSGLLYTLPQYLAEIAALLAVYGCARRLGYEVRASAAAACLFATFGLVSLEATTSQNDLVAASFAVVAACLLLGASRSEHLLAGAAIGIALGVKLTTLLVLPVLVWLALVRGRRVAGAALAGAACAFVALSMWVFVLNLIHTGTLIGPAGRAGTGSSPGYPRTFVTALDVLYTLMDLSVLSNHLIRVLEYVGIALGVVVAVYALLRRRRPERALLGGALAALPFLAPLIVIGGGDVLAWIGRISGHPIRGPLGSVGPLTRTVNSGASAFGPLGVVSLLAAAALTVVAVVLRRADGRQLALAASIPVCLVLLAGESSFNVFLPRFLLAAAALTAPLLARLLRNRVVTAAYLAVGATVLYLTVTHDRAKPLTSAYGRPWQLTQLEALSLVEPEDAPMLAAYDRLVPRNACVGAALGQDEPAYLLFGPRLARRVVFLPTPAGANSNDTVEAAYRSGVSYVVLSAGITPPTPPDLAPLPGQFAAAGWRLRRLGGPWTLAIAPHAVRAGCA